jgi:hypothetical protein
LSNCNHSKEIFNQQQQQQQMNQTLGIPDSPKLADQSCSTWSLSSYISKFFEYPPPSLLKSVSGLYFYYALIILLNEKANGIE